MNFMRRLNRGNFIFQGTVWKVSDLFRGMEVDNKCNISGEYLQNYASKAKKHRKMAAFVYF